MAVVDFWQLWFSSFLLLLHITTILLPISEHPLNMCWLKLLWYACCLQSLTISQSYMAATWLLLRGRPFNSWGGGRGWLISGHQEFVFLAIWWAGYFFPYFSHKLSITFVLHAIFFFRQALAGNFFSQSPTPPPHPQELNGRPLNNISNLRICFKMEWDLSTVQYINSYVNMIDAGIRFHEAADRKPRRETEEKQFIFIGI